MEKYIMYLRKSRSDYDYATGETEDVLKRHEEQLIKLAQAKGISLTQIEIYREIVSADTIAARPEMQRLLRRIEGGDITGVLVMEVERLARGDTLDQGTVARAFRLTNTLIITPVKTYDPNNQYDTEYFEFGLFMSRREYQAIKRRLTRGRVQSVTEGKYIGSVAPFGYDKAKLKGEKGYKLVINPKEAEQVKKVYDLFTSERMGTTNIAKEMNLSGYKPRVGEYYTAAVVRNILTRSVYCGILTWGRRKEETQIKDGNSITTRPRHKEYIIAEGLHEPIISKEQWEKAQEILRANKKETCPMSKPLQNAFAGIIKCGICGKNIQRRPYKSKPAYMLCQNINCHNVSSPEWCISDEIYNRLTEELNSYQSYVRDKAAIAEKQQRNNGKRLKQIESQREKLKKRYTRICDSYEDGIYDADTYRERAEAVKKELKALAEAEAEIKAGTPEKEYNEIKARIPLFETALRLYKEGSAKEKNDILKKIIERIEYTKTASGTNNPSVIASFELNITYKKLTNK